MPSGHPIVSGNGSICELIGKYLDLKPIVELLSSYSRNTGDVVRKIDNIHMEDDMWLVSLDVEALYTSIKHEDGIEATKAFFVMNSMPEVKTNFLLSLLEFTLRHNFFLLKESLCLQLQGTAVGASCVLSYTNLYLGLWGTFLTNPVRYVENVQLWTCFIDDISIGLARELIAFTDALNRNNKNIKLTVKKGQNAMEFLDVYSLETDMYRKTNR